MLLLALPLLAILYVLGSQGGSSWLFDTVAERLRQDLGISITWDSLSGDITSGLHFEGLAYRQPGSSGDLVFTTASLDLALALPQLVSRQIRVRHLTLGASRLALPLPDASPAEPLLPGALIEQLFHLPISLSVDELTVLEFSLEQGGQVQSGHIDSFSGGLDNSRLSLQDVELEWQDLALVLSSLELRNDLQVRAAVVWGLELENIALEGSLQAGGSLALMELEHTLLAPVTVRSSGLVSGIDTLALSFDLQHASDDYAGLLPPVPGLSLGPVSLFTRGVLDRIELGLEAEVGYSATGPGSLSLAAVYGGQSVTISSLALASTDYAAQLDLAGRVDLSSGYRIDAGWNLLAEAVPGLPMGIAVNELVADGRLLVDSGDKPGRPSIGLEIVSLKAEFNDESLDIFGKVAVEDNRLQDLQLDISQGNNRALVTGTLVDEADLQFDINLPELASLYDELQGSLVLSGRLRGDPRTPTISLDGQAAELIFANGNTFMTLASARIQAALSQEQSRLDADLLAFNAGSAEARFDSLSLRAAGRIDSHTLDLGLVAGERSLLVQAEGAWQNQAWQGAVAAIDLDSEFGNWQLEAPFSLRAGAARVDADALCVNRFEQRLCAELHWQAAEGMQAQLAIEALPLDWFNREETLAEVSRPALAASLAQRPEGLTRLLTDFSLLMPLRTMVEGSVDVSARVSLTAGQAELQTFAVNAAPAHISLALVRPNESELQSLAPEIDEYAMTLRQLAAAYQGGGWQADADVGISAMQQDISLESSIRGQVSLDSGRRLGGTLHVDFPDIAWLESLVPMLEEPGGSISLEAGLAGDLGRPLITSVLSVQGAHARVPTLGLDLQGISLQLVSDDNNHFSFSGGVSSGEGQLSLQGAVASPFLPERSLSLVLHGEHVDVLNLADRQLVVSPDISLDLDARSLSVNGNVDVPRFRLELSKLNFASDRVRVSNDVYVVEHAGENGQETAGQILRLPVQGTVSVNLGEDIFFSGYGLSLSLAGGLRLEQAVNRPLQAFGEVAVVDGRYAMYGQNLFVDNGRLFFIGNPANPALDIRATRDVQETTVGVQIGGTLSNIRSQLFSTPVLPETEVLAMLITGKSFNNVSNDEGTSMLAAVANLGIRQSSGLTSALTGALGLDSFTVSPGSNFTDSSLGIGKYITPDLFMEYKVGLVDNESVFSMDYRLTERLKLEVESGISQSIDITYTVQK